MSIKLEIQQLDSSRTALRKFGWTVGGVLLLISALLAWKGVSWYPVLLTIGALLVVLGSVLPQLLRPVFLAWMSLALAMGFVMTRVILTIFFCLVLVPVGLVFRLIGRDALHRKLDRGGATYWIEKRYPIADRSRYEKFF